MKCRISGCCHPIIGVPFALAGGDGYLTLASFRLHMNAVLGASRIEIETKRNIIRFISYRMCLCNLSRKSPSITKNEQVGLGEPCKLESEAWILITIP
jgi:hypothetical protein